MSTTQGIKLDETTIKRLKALAKQRNRSAHWLMRTAVEDFIERAEAYEKEKNEDLYRWESYLHTGKAIEHPKVELWLTDLVNSKVKKWPR